LRGACGLRARIVRRARKKDWGPGIIAGEPGERKKGINGGGGGNIGGSKNGGIGGGTGKNISEGINGGPLFKKRKGFIILFFLGCLRPRPLPPRLRGVVLPVETIKSKKKLIKNKIKIRNNARRVRPRYANKVECQGNI